jgi:hypothetical protein
MKIAKWMSRIESTLSPENSKKHQLPVNEEVDALITKANNTKTIQLGWTGYGHILIIPKNPLTEEATDHDKFENISIYHLGKINVYGIPK